MEATMKAKISYCSYSFLKQLQRTHGTVKLAGGGGGGGGEGGGAQRKSCSL